MHLRQIKPDRSTKSAHRLSLHSHLSFVTGRWATTAAAPRGRQPWLTATATGTTTSTSSAASADLLPLSVTRGWVCSWPPPPISLSSQQVLSTLLLSFSSSAPHILRCSFLLIAAVRPSSSAPTEAAAGARSPGTHELTGSAATAAAGSCRQRLCQSVPATQVRVPQ